MHHPMTPKEREARRAARLKIVQAVNRYLHQQVWRKTPPVAARLVSMRQIQRAVNIARRHRLVKPAVLERAGYRKVKR